MYIEKGLWVKYQLESILSDRLIAAFESQKIAEELEQAAFDSKEDYLIESYIILLDEANAIQTQLSELIHKTYTKINFEKQGIKKFLY